MPRAKPGDSAVELRAHAWYMSLAFWECVDVCLHGSSASCCLMNGVWIQGSFRHAS